VVEPGYRTAFVDWLACAVRGSLERTAVIAARVGSDALGRIVALGTAGHVLDFDDTYAPGLAHCTAPTAPAALVLGAQARIGMDRVLDAYAEGFEAMAAVARASHPEMYRRGFHPTAVCGVVGSAVASAAVLELDEERRANAVRLALVQAAGLRGAFGSDGKSLQVGLASAAGARAAILAEAGASASKDLPFGDGGFEAAYGATWAEPDPVAPAIRENWIKAYPCCLQTHSAIEAADEARRSGVMLDRATVTVHPISLQAAPIGVPGDPMEAKFSIPYTTAFTLVNGPPTVESFLTLDEDALALASRVEVTTDGALGESTAVLEAPGIDPIRVEAALGSPARPMDGEAIANKVRSLAGKTLEMVMAGDASEAPSGAGWVLQLLSVG
jgi:2-methylcitrate dehydratase PrpD